MIEDNTPVSQKRINFTEVFLHIGDADSLKHADAGYFVIGALNCYIIPEFNANPILKAKFPYFLLCIIELMPG